MFIRDSHAVYETALYLFSLKGGQITEEGAIFSRKHFSKY